MSYDIELCDPVSGNVLELDEPHQMKGGTYALGGTDLAELNVTYNYGHIFRRVLPNRLIQSNDPEYFSRLYLDGVVCGIRSIYGLTGAASIPLLERAIEQLGDDIDPDYWKATEGNAKGIIYLTPLTPRRKPMSEVLAQLYAGNPMSLTDDDLCSIEARCKRLESYRGARERVTRKARKGHSPEIEVYLPAKRVGGEQVLATFDDMDKAMLFVEALRYLSLLPPAVDQLRQRPELIEKNQAAMRG